MTNNELTEARRSARRRANEISSTGYLTEKESIAYAFHEHPEVDREEGAEWLSAELATYDSLVRDANTKVDLARRTVQIIDS